MWETFQWKCVSPCMHSNRSAKLQSRVNAIKLIFSKFDRAFHRNMSFLANSLRHRQVSQWHGSIVFVQKKQFSEIFFFQYFVDLHPNIIIVFFTNLMHKLVNFSFNILLTVHPNIIIVFFTNLMHKLVNFFF